MKKILFVDDEPNLLQGIRRVMRSMRNEWDMHFAEGGKNALQVMEEQPFDIVVTDMCMPGMDGVALLIEVKKRHPHVIRLVLSGHSDKEMILRCTNIAHQFIAKPCDSEMLRSVIDRSFSVQKLLDNPKLVQIVTEITTLPSTPSIYQELVDELSHSDASVNRVGEIVSRDAAMSARVLQLVNSAYFGLSRSVTSPAESVRMLGVDTLKGLVLATHIFEVFDCSKVGGFSITAQWDHSLQVGKYASQIVEAMTDDRDIASEAMVAGLVHDAGKLIFVEHLTDRYKQALTHARETEIPDWQAECKIIGATHAEVGAYLLGLWGLPAGIVEAVAFHHEPSKSKSNSFTALTAVHVADAFAHEPFGVGGESVMNQIDEAYLIEFGLIDHLPRWREICLNPNKENDAA